MRLREVPRSATGRRVRVTRWFGSATPNPTPDYVREGVLSWGRNPSFPRRMNVEHWWLHVPSLLSWADHDALSLQWAEDDTVEFLD